MDDVYLCLWVAFVAVFAIMLINDVIHRKDIRPDGIVHAPERTLRRYFFVLFSCIIAATIISFVILGALMVISCVVLGTAVLIRTRRLMLKRKANNASDDVFND